MKTVTLDPYDTPDVCWEKYKVRLFSHHLLNCQASTWSFIQELFGGLFKCSLRCPTCPVVSSSVESFQVLELHVRGSKDPPGEWMLQELIDSFCMSETLTEDNAQYENSVQMYCLTFSLCENCGEKVRMKKTMDLFRLPKVCCSQFLRSVLTSRYWSYNLSDF